MAQKQKQGQSRVVSVLLIVGGLVAVVAVAFGAGPVGADKKIVSQGLSASTVTIDVKDTDITRVLDAFSQQTGLSVVVGKDVVGTVSVRLLNIEWNNALDAIL